MKKIILLLGLLGAGLTACRKDLLDQVPTTQLSSELFWKTTEDAIYAVNGVYDANHRSTTIPGVTMPQTLTEQPPVTYASPVYA